MNKAKKPIFALFTGFIGALCLFLVISSLNGSGGMGLMAGPGGSDPMASPGFISQDTASSSYAQLNSDYLGFRIDADGYINFASTTGSAGYGIRDNSGTIEIKSYGGSWSGISAISVINDLTNVSASPTSGDVLYYNGANWDNLTITSSATGLEYATGTGIISLTSGYVIPLSASTTEWSNLYSNLSGLTQGYTLVIGADGLPTGTSSLIIDTNGKVGIGTSSPMSELTVVGDIRATGDLYASSSSLWLGDKKLTNNNGTLEFDGSGVGGGGGGSPTFEPNAGETISGATTPTLVYQLAADAEVYKTDADNRSKINFIGFATTDSTDGNAITVQTDGVVSGFTGLTTGSIYYISGTAGAITTTAGTYSVPIGIAVSTTEIAIKKDTPQFMYSNTVVPLTAGDSSAASGHTSYTKRASINVGNRDGNINVSFEIKNNSTKTTYARIYVNGVAVGTERTNNTTTYIEFNETIAIDPYDDVEIWLKTSDVGQWYYMRNFLLEGSALTTRSF